MIKVITKGLLILLCSYPPSFVLEVLVDAHENIFLRFMISVTSVMLSVVYIKAIDGMINE